MKKGKKTEFVTEMLKSANAKLAQTVQEIFSIRSATSRPFIDTTVC